MNSEERLKELSDYLKDTPRLVNVNFEYDRVSKDIEEILNQNQQLKDSWKLLEEFLNQEINQCNKTIEKLEGTGSHRIPIMSARIMQCENLLDKIREIGAAVNNETREDLLSYGDLYALEHEKTFQDEIKELNQKINYYMNKSNRLEKEIKKLQDEKMQLLHQEKNYTYGIR